MSVSSSPKSIQRDSISSCFVSQSLTVHWIGDELEQLQPAFPLLSLYIAISNCCLYHLLPNSMPNITFIFVMIDDWTKWMFMNWSDVIWGILSSKAKWADHFLPWAILIKGGQRTGRWGSELVGATGLLTFDFVLIKLDYGGLDGRFYHGGSHFNSVKVGLSSFCACQRNINFQGLSAKTREIYGPFLSFRHTGARSVD